MNRPQLNLARKWRSRNFDELIGQELSVRVLKNSLYLNQFFPVYLFSGQRGCGKTSTARIFAAALNCEKLSTFQQNPKTQSIPCLVCSSCLALQQGQHPDFIEMDAASHTGVDNVRQIIDAATLLPVMGRKKIYLIDEAHMLSKAAFNALLKILEEPPVSVIFILATTDVHKIIETVKSRCFQLLFKPIESPSLLQHLQDVCSQENITYENAALELLIKESDGSARDALNSLEHVRLSHEKVTVEAVHALYGHVEDGTIIELLEAVLCKTPQDLLTFWQTKQLETVSASYLYNAVRSCIRALMYQKYGVSCAEYSAYKDQLRTSGEAYSVAELTNILHFLFEQELLFVRIADQHTFLQNVLLQICQKKTSLTTKTQIRAENSHKKTAVQKENVAPIASVQQPPEQPKAIQSGDEQWQLFLHNIEGLQDPLLVSIFKQAAFAGFDQQQNKGTVKFAKESVFFNDWLTDTKNQWQPIIKKVFGAPADLTIIFDETVKAPQQPALTPVKIERPQPQPKTEQPRAYPQRATYQKQTYKKDIPLDVSDVQAWPITSMVVQHFPGMVCKETEGTA